MRLRGLELGAFARAVTAGWQSIPNATHVFVCVADHFEPDWQGASPTKQHERVARWVNDYPRSVMPFSDSRGRPPQHSFFYPIECYKADLIDSLGQLVKSGFGDIEVHLHHDNDTAEKLRELLCRSTENLHNRHGLLSKDSAGQVRYGFIHGNWALDNSHPDGRWCGVNNELTILRETGCYADFTMPAAPHPAQVRTINSIYYAIDDPEQPKSHDIGIPAVVGVDPPTNGLLMMQGPLLVRQPHVWSRPRIENGNIASSQPPILERLRDWMRARVKVKGQDEWLFIKLHAHGAQEKNADVLLGQAMHQFHHALRDFSIQQGFQFYYATAREMAQLVGQAEQGFSTPDFEHLSWRTLLK